MTTKALREFIRTEPAALFTEPLNVTQQGVFLKALYEPRQAKLAHAPGKPGWETLSKALDEAEARLSRLLESMVSLELGGRSFSVVSN